jgi:hypothetical protein
MQTMQSKKKEIRNKKGDNYGIQSYGKGGGKEITRKLRALR